MANKNYKFIYSQKFLSSTPSDVGYNILISKRKRRLKTSNHELENFTKSKSKQSQFDPIKKSSLSDGSMRCLMTQDFSSKTSLQPQLIKFRGKIEGFSIDEQPIFEIPKLVNLELQDVPAWIENFKQLQHNCKWNDGQAMSIMSTLASPEIYSIMASKRTCSSAIEALKQHVFPSNHYRRYREKIEKLNVRQ